MACIASLTIEVEVNQITVELQRALKEAIGALSAAPQAQVEQDREINSLRDEIRQLKEPSFERQKNSPRAVQSDAFAYMPHDAAATGERAPWLCTSCIEVGRKSIMQPIGSKTGDTTRQFQPCKSKFETTLCSRPAYSGNGRERPSHCNATSGRSFSRGLSSNGALP